LKKELKPTSVRPQTIQRNSTVTSNENGHMLVLFLFNIKNKLYPSSTGLLFLNIHE